MKRPPDHRAPVTIVRSGYATDRQWHDAIRSAWTHKLDIIAIDERGHILDATALDEILGR